MLNPSAEEKFRKGKKLLESGQAREALALLSAALEIDRQADPDAPGQARYLSYYGLCLCLTRNGTREALRSCRTAVQQEGYRPNLWWNLGRVALAAGRRAEAFRALHWGLELQPDHPGILRDLKRMGLRRPPVLSFLSRRNPINVALGRLRGVLARSRSKRRPVPGPAPVSRSLAARAGS